MNTNFKDLMLRTLVLLFSAVVIFPACNSSTAGTQAATMLADGQWRSKYIPANTQAGTYAALNVYSTSTGEFYQLYANEGAWHKNPNFPALPVAVDKGNIRMEFMPATLDQFAGMSIYSATTGDWKQYYLQNKEWILNPNFPTPAISLPKGNLRMDFVPGSPNGGLAGLNVFCTKTKQFEMFYLDESGEWKINTAFPTAKQI